MFVHSADELAEMRTKFHAIQAKLIMSVWRFTVHCYIAEVLCKRISNQPTVTKYELNVEKVWFSINQNIIGELDLCWLVSMFAGQV